MHLSFIISFIIHNLSSWRLYTRDPLSEDPSLAMGLKFSDQFCYNQRYDYLKLIKSYLRKEIPANLFISRFISLFNAEIYCREKLEIDPKSRGFSDLICRIFSYCDHFDTKWDVERNLYYMPKEEKFEALIQLSFLELQDYIDKENSSFPYQDLEVLQLVMVFFSFLTTISFCFLKPEIYHLLS